MSLEDSRGQAVHGPCAGILVHVRLIRMLGAVPSPPKKYFIDNSEFCLKQIIELALAIIILIE